MFKKVFSTSTVLLLAASTSFQSAAAVDQQVEVEAGATSPPPAPKLDDVAEELGGLAQELEDLAKDEASTEAFKSPPSAPSTNSQPSAPSNDESSSQSKSSKSMSKSGKNKASEMDVFIKLNFARLSALQFVSLYAGDKDFVCDLLDETGLEDVVSFVDCSLTSGKARKLSHESGDGFGANVDDITFELFVGWQDQGYSADDVKEKLDGVLLELIPNYNTGGGYDNNDDDDSFSGKTWKPDGRKLRR